MRHKKLRNKKEVELLRTNVKQLMEEKYNFPAELAAVTMIPLSSLCRYLNEEVTNPGVDFVISLSKGLGVSVGELFEEPSSQAK